MSSVGRAVIHADRLAFGFCRVKHQGNSGERGHNLTCAIKLLLVHKSSSSLSAVLETTSSSFASYKKANHMAFSKNGFYFFIHFWTEPAAGLSGAHKSG
jgi:hypothetical protein